MTHASTGSTKLLFAVSALLIGVVVSRAAILPLTGAEAVTWERMVRPEFRVAALAPEAWSGLFYGWLAKRSAGLFRLSAFSLRLPAVLSGILYLWALQKICRVALSGLLMPIAFLPLAIAPVWLDCFSLAGGTGPSLALCALALAVRGNPGFWLGLALAACPSIWIGPVTVAVGLMIRHGFWRGAEVVAIPSVATAFMLLLIPLSHAGPPLPQASRPSAAESALQSAVGVLRQGAGKRPTRIAASPSVAPLVEFYRARYRERAWSLDARNADYLVWREGETPPSARPAQVLFRGSGVVLAH